LSSLLLLFILIFPMGCSFIGYFIGTKNEKFRDIFNVAVTGLVFLCVTYLYRFVAVQPIDISIKHIMGTGVHLRLDPFRYVFVWITTLVWFLIMIYSTQYLTNYKNRNRYYMFFMLTLGSTIGVFISENFLNLFTFFEIMSFTSYALIIHDEDDYSHDAGNTYIAMAVAGGLILLMGLFLLYNYTQTLDISLLYDSVKELGSVKYIISSLIIIGFGVKAGMVPLHVWLPKAHPAAPAPASAILSGILLKTGVFGIILTMDIMLKGDFYISVVILVIGFINMFLGGVLAVFQRNIKRILAYSSMSQIGYILVGVGLIGILKDHNTIAIYGTLFHIVNHGLFKVLLFMSAGIVYMMLHELSIDEIGGFGRNRIWLKAVFLTGLLAIIGMPGFNGFISKTLLHEALAEAHHIYHNWLFTLAEIIFTLSSSLTVAYLLKIFVAVFLEKGKKDFADAKVKPNRIALLPMVILSAIIIYIGVRPDIVIKVLEGTLGTFGEVHPVEVHFFTLESVRSSMFTILIGVIIYLGFVRKVLRRENDLTWYYINPSLKWINLENHIYKPVGRMMFHGISILFKIIDNSIVGIASYLSSALEKIGEIEFDYGKNIIRSMWEKINNQKNKQDNKDAADGIAAAKYSIRERVGTIHQSINSVTYSIFIFAAVLVILLIVLIY
jgi:hydrogenase-4 component B